MTTSAQNRFIEIGRIGRPHGLGGVVRIVPNEYFTAELLRDHSLVYMRDYRSDLVPARIEQVHTETKRNQQTFFVKFDMITSRSDAEAAMNQALFVEKKIAEAYIKATEEPLNLGGFRVVNNGIDVGEILDVMQNPAHPILEVKYGTGTILVPMVDEYIDKTDTEKRVVFCRNLDLLTGL